MTIGYFLGLVGPLYLMAVAWPLARVDIREHRLPNRLTLPAFPVTIVSQVLAVLLGENWAYLATAAGAAVTAFVAGLVLNRYAGLGMGDVKLITAITLALAWFSPLVPLVALAIALVLAGAVATAMVVLQKARMGSSIALGPYLLVGFVLSLIGQGWS
jgi:leader peptidase (prepilin peptidase) / N-methyltransferase